MFVYTFDETETYDSVKNKFCTLKSETHSFDLTLKVIADWEGATCEPFFNSKLDGSSMQPLMQLMCLDGGFNPAYITDDFITKMSAYISEPHTATKIHSEDTGNANPSTYMTSELVYAMMFELHIPLACEVWNINRLMTLIRVMQIRARPQKRMGSATVAERNRALNAQRRAQLKTKG